MRTSPSPHADLPRPTTAHPPSPRHRASRTSNHHFNSPPGPSNGGGAAESGRSKPPVAGSTATCRYPPRSPLHTHTPTYGVTPASHASSIAAPDRHASRTRSTDPAGRNNFSLVPSASRASRAPSGTPISIPLSYLNSGCAHQYAYRGEVPRFVYVYETRTRSSSSSMRRPSSHGTTRPKHRMNTERRVFAPTSHGILHASPWSGSVSVASTVGTISSHPKAPPETNPTARGSSMPMPCSSSSSPPSRSEVIRPPRSGRTISSQRPLSNLKPPGS